MRMTGDPESTRKSPITEFINTVAYRHPSVDSFKSSSIVGQIGQPSVCFQVELLASSPTLPSFPNFQLVKFETY